MFNLKTKKKKKLYFLATLANYQLIKKEKKVNYFEVLRNSFYLKKLHSTFLFSYIKILKMKP